MRSEAETQVSVVIASLVGAPFIDECLSSLEAQVRRCGAETIVVACGTSEYAQRIAQKFPWTRVIRRVERESVPALRSHGVEAATGRLVAVIEEHCLAAPDWLERAVKAHASGTYGAVGGPVSHYRYRRLRDWVVYFCEYNGYMPPWRDGETLHLGSANIVYSRDVLGRYKDLLHDGYWEAGLHGRLIADGVKFCSVSHMVVYHRGPFDYGYYLRQRFWFSRAFFECAQPARFAQATLLGGLATDPFSVVGAHGTTRPPTALLYREVCADAAFAGAGLAGLRGR